MAPCRLCRPYHIFVSGIGRTKFDVVLNRVWKQIYILKDHTDILHQTVQFIIPDINTTNSDAAAVNIPKTCYQIYQSCFSGTGRANNSCGGSLRYHQRHMVDYFLIAIGKTHIPHFNIQPGRALFFTINIDLWALIDFFYTVNRSINHRKHKKHFSRTFQLAIHHKR